MFSRSDLNTDLIRSWTYSAKFAPIYDKFLDAYYPRHFLVTFDCLKYSSCIQVGKLHSNCGFDAHSILRNPEFLHVTFATHSDNVCFVRDIDPEIGIVC